MQGITSNKKEIKLPADIITLNLSNITTLKNALNTLIFVQMCSSLKSNIDKNKAKYIGKTLNPDYYPHGLSWMKTPLETFCIYITNYIYKNVCLMMNRTHNLGTNHLAHRSIMLYHYTKSLYGTGNNN